MSAPAIALAGIQGRHPRQHGSWRAHRVARNLFCLTVVLAVYVQLGLPFNVAPADVPLAAMLLLGVRALGRREGGPFDRLFWRQVPAMWLLGIATVLSMTEIGIEGYAVDHGLRDMLSLLTPVLLGAYLWPRRGLLRHGFTAFAVAGAFVAVGALVGGDGLRAASTFNNPNYAAHFLATAIVVVLFAPWRWVVKIPVCAFLVVGMFPTGSFGGSVVVAGALIVVVFRQSDRLGTHAGAVVKVLLALIVGWMLIQGATAFEEGDYDLGSGASSARFDRSRDTRLTLWGDGIVRLEEHPLGVGPRAFKLREDLERRHRGEIHNDYVSFFVEQGPLGLLAMLWILVTLWRLMPRQGPARALAFGFALSAVFREVVNFRHVWLALVLFVICDLDRRRTAGVPVP